ncbi:MAG: hypothetical protein ACI9G1_002613 [Pirellulaceae bacterium]|jgi:hypothetical protein
MFLRHNVSKAQCFSPFLAVSRQKVVQSWIVVENKTEKDDYIRQLAVPAIESRPLSLHCPNS